MYLQSTYNSQTTYSGHLRYHSTLVVEKAKHLVKTRMEKKWSKRGSATPKVFTFLFNMARFCSLCCRRRLWKAQQATERKSAQPLAQRHAAAAIPATLHRPSKVNNPLNTVSMWFTGGLPFTHAALRCEQFHLKNCLHLLRRDSVPKYLERTVQLQRGQWDNKQEEIAERVNTLLLPRSRRN